MSTTTTENAHPMTHTLSLALDEPEFRLEKAGPHGTRYTLHFEKDGSRVEVELSSAALDALVHQGEALLPRPEIGLPDPEVEKAWRSSAWVLKQLSDRDWQLLLRECQSDGLLVLLWYLKDREIGRAVMRNCSARVAAMLTDDLTHHFFGQDPDLASEAMRRQGRAELTTVIALVHRLADEGQMVLRLRAPLYDVNAGSRDASANGETS